MHADVELNDFPPAAGTTVGDGEARGDVASLGSTVSWEYSNVVYDNP